MSGFVKTVLILGFAALVVGAFLLFGPPQLLATSETPEFCAACHVHESHYEAWFHVGAHRSLKCVDCHLPGESLAAHYVWKSIDGMRDVAVFYSGRAPDILELTDHAKAVLQANCIRCHEGRVAMIDQQRPCWECHRFVQHRRAGVRENANDM